MPRSLVPDVEHLRAQFISVMLQTGKCLLALLLLGSSAHAQYRFDTWTAENGLPQNIIRDIEQTSDGYLWLATLNGLARFDGVRFTIFDKSNTSGINSNRFSSMRKGKGGDLWLSVEGGQLTRYHQGSFHTYTARDLGLNGQPVQGLASDAQGHIWALVGDGIFAWDDTAGRFAEITPKGSKISYIPLRWEVQGFWGCDQDKLHIFLEGKFLTYKLPSWLPGKSIWGVARDNDSIFWIETLAGKQAKLMPSEGSQPVALLHSEAISYPGSHGHVWIMHIGGRLDRYLDYVSSGKVSTVLFSRFFQDQQENLWLGTEGQGLYRLQKQAVSVYSVAQGSIGLGVYPIFEDRENEIWVGAWATGLDRLYGGKFSSFSVAEGLPGKLVTALAEDSRGQLWVGTHGGLAVMTNGHLHRPTGVSIPDDSAVQAILQDHQGVLWFGSGKGLFRFKDGSTQHLTEHDGLATDDVRVMIESAIGDLWIGGYGGLSHLHNGHFTRLTERDGLPSDNVRALYEDADGTLWIGTYDGGLGRLKGTQLTRYRMHDGLSDNGVFQILEDHNGYFWMSSNHGIYRVSKKELTEFAEGKRRTIDSALYGVADGMSNVECNGGLWPAGIKTHDGKLLFPTQNGIAAIDPDIVADDPPPPPAQIEAARINHVDVPVNATVVIAPGNENLEIDYTAPSFVKPEGMRFRYQLVGLDSDWVGAESRRTAYYSHLPPGSYTFKVMAGNGEGNWNESGRTLAVRVLAPFYETSWFTGLVMLLVAGLVTIAWRIRVSQLKAERAQQQAFSRELIASQEQERKRIAGELHDGLGQRLVIINNLAAGLTRARAKSTAEDVQAKIVEEIGTEAQAAIKETRDISYDLRPSQLDRLGLTKALAGVIRKVSEASGIAIQSSLNNVDDLFPEDQRIHLYRIVQESLTNIMKHAQATEVNVRIERTGHRMMLIIQDNGVGFSSDQSEKPKGSGGFGLSGMAERAQLFGGVFRISSMAGRGTIVTVEVNEGGKNVG